MKVQLIVVRGKPEGKVIPLSGSKFKIGRGETCHLRPNSEQVSREHAEFCIVDGVVTVADLGSRNGTLVNGKVLDAGPHVLVDGSLVQVGPLTFAVSIKDAAPATAPSPPKAAPVHAAKPVAAPASPAASPPQAKTAKSAPEDVLNEEIDAWLVGEAGGSNSDLPTSVYGGETITIAAFKDGGSSSPPAPAAKSPSKQQKVEVEEEQAEEEEAEEEEVEEILEDSLDDEEDEEDDDDEEEGGGGDEFIDESNPFYAAKKAQQDAAKASTAGPKSSSGPNQQFKDTSDAASEILRKLREKRHPR